MCNPPHLQVKVLRQMAQSLRMTLDRHCEAELVEGCSQALFCNPSPILFPVAHTGGGGEGMRGKLLLLLLSRSRPGSHWQWRESGEDRPSGHRAACGAEHCQRPRQTPLSLLERSKWQGSIGFNRAT